MDEVGCESLKLSQLGDMQGRMYWCKVTLCERHTPNNNLCLAFIACSSVAQGSDCNDCRIFPLVRWGSSSSMCLLSLCMVVLVVQAGELVNNVPRSWSSCCGSVAGRPFAEANEHTLRRVWLHYHQTLSTLLHTLCVCLGIEGNLVAQR